MARPVGLSLVHVSQARTVTGAPVVADSGSLVDANYPPIPDNVLGGAINGFGFSTLWLNVELAGGTAPTVQLDLLFRDDGAADGSRWKFMGGPLLDGTAWTEVRVDGQLVYPKLSVVNGAPTGVNILARPGLRLAGRAAY